MDREITKIIDRLQELKSRANELGQEQQTFEANIEAAESILEVARKEVEEVKRRKGPSPPPPLAELVSQREALRECVADLDRAAAECQEAKREALETLAETDAMFTAVRCRPFSGDARWPRT